MSDRYTRKDAEGAFLRLCAVCNKQPATDYADKGAWALDYAPVYGGYAVRELMDGGGAAEPFGSTRRSARDFCYTVNFAIRAIEQAS